MNPSILGSTKKTLNLSESYVAFDEDIIMYINSTFSVLNQLGIGPTDGFSITDNTAVWDDYQVPANQLGMVKSYVYLKVRMLFDPPGTSYLIEAMNKQIGEFEYRLNNFREVELQRLLDQTQVVVEEDW